MSARFEYDPPTKFWTVVTGVLFMLLIQWPALFTAILQSPNTRGNMLWNVVACIVGMVFPLVWWIDDVARRRIGLPWLLSVIAIGVWTYVSIGLVNS